MIKPEVYKPLKPTTTYETIVVGEGNHASLEIPDNNLAEIGGNRRAPLKITINDCTYQSTATGVGGKCMVVFPIRYRQACGSKAGDRITVKLELDNGYREVVMPAELTKALAESELTEVFRNLTYSKRREFARQISEAKSDKTKSNRIDKILSLLK